MAKFPQSPALVDIIAVPNYQVGVDVGWFDDSIRQHGCKFVHYRAIPDPTGLLDKFDSRRPGIESSESSNGFLYFKAGTFTGLITGNSKNDRDSESGWMSEAEAQITPPRYYDCNEGPRSEPVYLAPFDRLYLAESTTLVTQSQLMEVSETGVDRLRYPAERVILLVDTRGIQYTCGKDFAIVGGNLSWNKSPGIDPQTGHGRVYSIRYLYHPHWYVDRLVHEIRVTHQINPMSGAKEMVQMPQCAAIQREYVFRNKDQGAQAEPDRQVPVAPDGSFGPR